MKIRICSTCGKDETEVDFYKTGSYCKYCKSILEARRRFLTGCEKHKDDINQLYKYQRFFLYNLHVKRNRSLEMCSQIMGYSVGELKFGLSEMGYYQDDPCWCSNCARFKPRNEFRTASNRKKNHQDWCNECKTTYIGLPNIKKKRKQYMSRYREENPEKIAEWALQYNYSVEQATVKWADLNKIKEIYKLRNKLTEETGIPHHVDHIIPLQHELVCGLHVENNLQILTAEENQRKSNKFEPIIESLVE